MAYVTYEPNRPQESAQPVHGSGAEVQDHDPGASQLSSETVSRTAPPGSEPSEDDGSSPPSMEQSETAAPATTVSNNDKALKRCWKTPRWSHSSVRRTQQPSRRATRFASKTVENAEITEIKCAVFRALTRLKSYRDEGIRRD